MEMSIKFYFIPTFGHKSTSNISFAESLEKIFREFFEAKSGKPELSLKFDK